MNTNRSKVYSKRCKRKVLARLYEVLKLLERTSIIDVLFYYLLNIHKIKKSPFKIEGANLFNNSLRVLRSSSADACKQDKPQELLFQLQRVHNYGIPT